MGERSKYNNVLIPKLSTPPYISRVSDRPVEFIKVVRDAVKRYFECDVISGQRDPF